MNCDTRPFSRFLEPKDEEKEKTKIRISDESSLSASLSLMIPHLNRVQILMIALFNFYLHSTLAKTGVLNKNRFNHRASNSAISDSRHEVLSVSGPNQ